MKNSVLNRLRIALDQILRRPLSADSAGDLDLLLQISMTVSETQDDHRRFLIAQRRWAELGAGVVLDEERLQRIEGETERVSALLEKVFARKGGGDPAANPDDPFPGLEKRHAGFLAELSTHEMIRPAAFTALARRHGLLPAGAMEAINDWAFDRIGEAVLNDGDPIGIACDLLRPREIDHRCGDHDDLFGAHSRERT